MKRVAAAGRYCLSRASLTSVEERGASLARRGRRRSLSAEHDAARSASQRERQVVGLYLELLRARRANSVVEDEFVAVAERFARRNGIDFASWVEVGVDPAVLDRARIRR